MNRRRIQALLAGMIVLIALLLRVNAIERRPLHFDEGNSVYFGLHWPDVLALSNDNAEADPPAHRILLGVWMTLAGTSPFAIRALSAGLGVVAVALTWPFGRALGLRPQAALLVMALLAVSPFHVDYSQEAKSYALVSAMALASSLAWLRIGRSRLAPAAYVFCTLFMLGAHYFSAPLLAMQWVWLLADRSQLRRDAPRRAMLQALASGPVGLWIALAWRGILAGGARVAGTPHPFAPLTVLGNILGEFALGRTVEGTVVLIGAFLFAGLWVAGLFMAHRRARLMLVGASGMIALVFALVVEPRLSIFYPRFLLWSLPMFMAPMVALLGQRSALHLAGGVALAATEIAGLGTFYSARIDTDNDFRPLIAQVRPLIREGDAALGTYIWMDGMWASYAPETLRSLTWVRDFYQQDGRDLEALMAPVSAAHPRVWHLNFNRNPDDTATLSAQWLKRNTAYAARFRAGSLSVLLFESSPFEPPGTATSFGDRVQLGYAPQRRSARPGDVVRLNVRWTPSQPTGDLAIFTHLIGPDGRLIAQNDGDAVNGLRPAFTWKPNEGVDDPRALLVPTGVPPGEYQIRIGLYQRADGRRLTTSTGADFVLVGTLDIN